MDIYRYEEGRCKAGGGWAGGVTYVYLLFAHSHHFLHIYIMKSFNIYKKVCRLVWCQQRGWMKSTSCRSANHSTPFIILKNN